MAGGRVVAAAMGGRVVDVDVAVVAARVPRARSSSLECRVPRHSAAVVTRLVPRRAPPPSSRGGAATPADSETGPSR